MGNVEDNEEWFRFMILDIVDFVIDLKTDMKNEDDHLNEVTSS